MRASSAKRQTLWRRRADPWHRGSCLTLLDACFRQRISVTGALCRQAYMLTLLKVLALRWRQIRAVALQNSAALFSPPADLRQQHIAPLYLRDDGDGGASLRRASIRASFIVAGDGAAGDLRGGSARSRARRFKKPHITTSR